MDQSPSTNRLTAFGIALWGADWQTPMTDALLPHRPPSRGDDRTVREEHIRSKRAVHRWLTFGEQEPVWVAAAIPHVVAGLVHRRRMHLRAIEKAASDMRVDVAAELLDILVNG